MITHIKFVGVPTRDQAAALKFWTEKIGFVLKTDQPLGDQRWIELSTPKGDTGLVLFTPPGHEDRIGGFFNGSLACDDVEATHRQLSARGVEFTAEPQKQPWGTFAKFKDPDGNEFVLSSR
jgi:predicted enzyme related to lactoylglutathione lyase